MVHHQEPEVRLSMSNQDSLVTLGQGRVRDFSGEAGSVQFTDYKKAYTDGSTLIDIHSVDLRDRANSIGGVKAQRSNISYQMSSEDERLHALQVAQTHKEEQKRLRRLNLYDKKHEESYEKIHSMLLR